jgi:hypothetical protein
MLPCHSAAAAALLIALYGLSAGAGEARPLLTLEAFPAALFASEASRFLHLEVKEPGKMESAFIQVALGSATALELTYRVRWRDVRRGAKPWFDARIILDFKDAKGGGLPGGPPAPNFTGTSLDWHAERLLFAVPAGAVTLNVMPALLQAESGSLDIAALALTAIDPAQLPPQAGDAHGEPAVQVDGGGRPPAPLHVDGRRLLDAHGTEVWLQGVNVPSLDWSNSGEAVLPSLVTAIAVWKANVIRLPVSGERWFGREPGQQDGGAAYRALVAQAVRATSSRGAWLILDLHRFRAPTDADVAFWTSAAAAFKDDPAVVFGLFNEPHDVSWAVWRDGGDVTDRKQGGDALAENKEAVTTFHSPGLQALVAAARGTGARNLILAGGLDWSYNLSGILDGHALDDLGGSGIVYDTHVYPWKGDWQGKFLAVAERHPVLLGEVGCDSKRYDFIPPERFENPYTWAPDILACIQSQRLPGADRRPACLPPHPLLGRLRARRPARRRLPLRQAALRRSRPASAAAGGCSDRPALYHGAHALPYSTHCPAPRDHHAHPPPPDRRLPGAPARRRDAGQYRHRAGAQARAGQLRLVRPPRGGAQGRPGRRSRGGHDRRFHHPLLGWRSAGAEPRPGVLEGRLRRP